MLPDGENVALTGSYSSAELSPVVPSNPPTTSTAPLASSVAVCNVRGELIDAVDRKPCSSTSIVVSCGVADWPLLSPTDSVIGNAPVAVGVPDNVPSTAK